MSPEVTVLLPIYNGAKYLRSAIDSVLNQTFLEFELLIIDDGSTDNSAAIVESYTDSRISFIRQSNRGLAATLNRGLSLVRSAYIARQDQDDLSHPERLERQLNYMRLHNDVVLLGTAAEIWIENSPSGRFHDHPTNKLDIHFDLLFNNPFVHSSVMLRRAAIESVGGYCEDRERQPPEDYELWSRLARQYAVANLSERLVVYRETNTSMSRNKNDPFTDKVVLIAAENIARANQIELDCDCMSLAAFVHSTTHLIDKRVDLERMINLIQRATLFIQKSDVGYLNDKMQGQIASLRAQHHREFSKLWGIYKILAAARRVQRLFLASFWKYRQ